MRRLKLALLADEHLGLKGSRKGGFGWATRQVATWFAARPELGVDPVVLNCVRTLPDEDRPAEVDGVPMLWRGQGRLGLFRFGAQAPDLFLSIDYRPNYRIALLQRPFTPVVLWVRDPWGPAEHRVLAGLRLPGAPDCAPDGVAPPDHTTFHQIWRQSRLCGRRLVFGVTGAFLRRRVAAAYAIPEPPMPILPNLLEIRACDVRKTERPSVLFLARLDPVKRPWVAVELARSFPEVDFNFAGQAHFDGPRTWRPVDVPPNVHFLGHIDGEEKRRLIASSWVLLNTSIHEGLPVSLQEAMACGVVPLGTLDSDGLVSRYGTFVGEYEGDGLQALPALRDGLRTLIADPARCFARGQEGFRHITSVHNPEAFLEGFTGLAAQVGREVGRKGQA